MKRIERAKKANNKRQQTWKAKKEHRLLFGDWSSLSCTEQRERIRREQNFKCEACNVAEEWNGSPLKFELDHISGCRTDDSRENLRLLCPNCHSQTSTYKNKSRGDNPRNSYTDEQIIQALKSSNSVYDALKSLGMNCHGGNYTRVRNIVRKYALALPYILL